MRKYRLREVEFEGEEADIMGRGLGVWGVIRGHKLFLPMALIEDITPAREEPPPGSVELGASGRAWQRGEADWWFTSNPVKPGERLSWQAQTWAGMQKLDGPTIPMRTAEV